MDIDDYEHHIPDEPQSQVDEEQVDILELNKPPEHIAQRDADPQNDFFDLDELDPVTATVAVDANADVAPEETVPVTEEKTQNKGLECLVRELDQDDFQEWWVDIEEELEGSVKPCGPKTLSHDLGDFLEDRNIVCMASKDNDDGNQQFYVYAYLGTEDEDPDDVQEKSWILAEINLWSATKEVEYLLKGFDEEKVKQFETILIGILKK